MGLGGALLQVFQSQSGDFDDPEFLSWKQRLEGLAITHRKVTWDLFESRDLHGLGAAG